jgi:hypothetical protein
VTPPVRDEEGRWLCIAAPGCTAPAVSQRAEPCEDESCAETEAHGADHTHPVFACSVHQP